MTQVTWRATDELVERVRTVAESEGRSMNEYITRVMEAVTNPELAGAERERLRERLARAGLLATAGQPRVRPSGEAVAAAGREAVAGSQLSDLVGEGRGPR